MKKGFTLVELLAVIVILAVLALIATPVVLSIIDDTKESAMIRSAEMYLSGVENAVMRENMKTGGNFRPTECTITNGDMLCSNTTVEVEVNGEVPSSGSVVFESGKIKEVILRYKLGVIQMDENGKLVNGWIQKKTIVTDGTTTLVVGDNVFGYGIELEKGYWMVLGAENGRLLLTTSSNVTSVTLTGANDYFNGVSKLDNAVSEYLDSNLASKVRSINVEDINRVTGYHPVNNAPEPKSQSGTYGEYGDIRTFYLKDGKVVSDSSIINITTGGTPNAFTHIDGMVLVDTANKDEKNNKFDRITVESTAYGYFPATLTTSNNPEKDEPLGVSWYSKQWAKLFYQGDYWLATPTVFAGRYGCVWKMFSVANTTNITTQDLYDGYSGDKSKTMGVRPVVELKKDVIFTEKTPGESWYLSK